MPKQIPQSARKVRDSLASQLRKHGIKHDRLIAKYLLNQGLAWRRRYGETSFWFTSKVGINDPDYKVSQAQKDLIDAGFMTRVGRDVEKHKFVPTKRLMDFVDKYEVALKEVNEELSLSHEYRIVDLENRVRSHERQLIDIWEAIRNIERNDPPVTEEKLVRYLELVKPEPAEPTPEPDQPTTKRRSSADW
jgi:hypothetical protein